MALDRNRLKALDPEVRSYIESLENRDRHWETRYGQLVEEAEQGAEVPEPTETVSVETHQRKKAGRKPIDEKVPRVEILHDIKEADKRCACGHELVRIGEEVSERLQVIPERMYVERHIRPKYACKHCEGSGDEERPAVRIAPVPPSVIPGSIVTPGLLAFILVNKFVDHLPFYRQEARFERIGIHISRQDMSNWAIASAARIEPLIQLYRLRIQGGPVVHMDETPVQVLSAGLPQEPDRSDTARSYMWLARGGPPESPVLLYHYEPSRGRRYPAEILSGYRGYLQADGYEVYDRVAEAEGGVTLVGCWAHARRKFHEAATASKKAGAGREGIERIRKLYRIEEELRSKELPSETFLEQRRKLAEPVLEDLNRWLTAKSEKVVPSSLLGKAVGYTLSQRHKLVRYLEHPALTPDNNAAENAIRPFVLGRKNWLFSGSPRGADASCALYSVIETAKANGLNPFAYLHLLFEQAPLIRHETEWEAFLPENLDAEEANNRFLAAVR